MWKNTVYQNKYVFHNIHDMYVMTYAQLDYKTIFQ